MRPTRWRRKLNDWNDCRDYRAHERQDRKREAAEEVAGQLRDAEPEIDLDEVLAAEQEQAEQAAREAACPGHLWDHRSSPFADWEVCRLCGMEEEL